MALTDLKELGFNPKSVNRLKLVELLTEKYPDYQWDNVYLLRGRLAQQKRLENCVKQLFPVFILFFLSLYFISYLSYYFQDVQIHINARKEAEIINPDTMAYLEIDVFLPSLNLGFEYQVPPSLNKKKIFISNVYRNGITILK